MLLPNIFWFFVFPLEPFAVSFAILYYSICGFCHGYTCLRMIYKQRNLLSFELVNIVERAQETFSAVSGQRWWFPRFLKLDSLRYLLPLCVFKYFSFFRVRVPVVFYLNMSKKGKKQDGTTSPFLFAINHRKSCSKRHLKNIILLTTDLCACVCACVRACVFVFQWITKLQKTKVNLVKGPWLVSL